MIVAIVNQTVPVGVVFVEEFLEAVDETTAVSVYCNGYTPPRNTADYLGFDTGWAEFVNPGPFFRWGYDFAAPGLVQVAVTPDFELKVSNQIIAQATALAGAAFSELGGLVAAPGVLFSTAQKLVLRVTGLYRATGAGAKLVVDENGVHISIAIPLADTAGVFTPFAFNVNLPINNTLNVYTLNGLLGAAVLAEIKYISFNLLVF